MFSSLSCIVFPVLFFLYCLFVCLFVLHSWQPPSLLQHLQLQRLQMLSGYIQLLWGLFDHPLLSHSEVDEGSKKSNKLSEEEAEFEENEEVEREAGSSKFIV